MGLVLKVKERGEGIVICDDIRITVSEVRGNNVRLNIEAPKTIPVHRESIYRAIKEQGAKKHVQEVGPPSDGSVSAIDGETQGTRSLV